MRQRRYFSKVIEPIVKIRRLGPWDSAEGTQIDEDQVTPRFLFLKPSDMQNIVTEDVINVSHSRINA